MHTDAPLQGDDGTLDRLQHKNRKGQRKRKGCHGMNPEWRRKIFFQRKGKAHHYVAQNHNHDIRRKIVGAVMVEFLAADIAAIDDLQPFPEKLSVPAMWATAGKAAKQVL